MNAEALRSMCEAAGMRIGLAGYLSVKQVCAILGRSPKCLQNWRRDGTGPPCRRLGGYWAYRIDTLAEWMDGRA